MSGILINSVKWCLDAVLPRFCTSCDQEGSLLCRSCYASWITNPEVKTKSFSSFSYADPISRGLIRAWKYNFDNSAWRILATEISKQDQALIAFCTAHNIKKIVWLPLHYQRRNERGFDQAEIIARFISHITNIPVEPILHRKTSTSQQARMSDIDRRKIVKNKPFKCLKSLNGEHILLVDDVITTGSSMRSAQRELTNMGAGHIYWYAILRAK